MQHTHTHTRTYDRMSHDGCMAGHMSTVRFLREKGSNYPKFNYYCYAAYYIYYGEENHNYEDARVVYL